MVAVEAVTLDSFRQEARDWIAANFPPSLRGKASIFHDAYPLYPEGEDFALWKKRVGEKGWGVPTWPTRYGGGGLSPAQARILLQEYDRAEAFNPIAGMGVAMFGPTLLEYGTEEQKMRHIPPIARGELRWCQGYSEPGAGSDLASLQTKAEDAGKFFKVNGQKIWTSGAHHAHWCFCLVRTDSTKKHEGISFIMFDMKTPGVEPRPLLTISGQSPFCEVFLTDVMVPKENLVGKLNQGWTIGKRLLQHERSNLSLSVRRAAKGDGRALYVIAKEYVGVDDKGRVADADLRARIVRYEIEAKALALTLERSAAESKSGQGPSAASSILKNARGKLTQERGELLAEIMGYRGIGWEGEGFTPTELDSARAWLSNRAVSIFGGSYEIQNNIIAKRILGLLDHQ